MLEKNMPLIVKDDPEAVEVWNEWFDTVNNVTEIRPIDYLCFGLLCIAMVEYRKLRAVIRVEGYVFENAKGGTFRNALVIQLNKSEDMVQKYMRMFNMAPKHRGDKGKGDFDNDE